MTFIPQDHYRNRERVPESELAPHYGKHVAWSLDGTQILASDDDPREVCAAVQRAGLKSSEVVIGYVPLPDEVVLGGAWLADEEESA
jgi:hypothetical protein